MATYCAYSIHTPGEPLELQTCSLQFAIDDLPAKGVFVKISAVGVCHSDVHLWHGYYQVGRKKDEVIRFTDRPGISYPIVPGHEITGSVYAVGDQVLSHSGVDLKVGDRVIVYPWIGCDRCHFCKAGDHHLCSHSRELGFVKDGGYSEFVAVPHYHYIFKTPGNVSDSLAAMLPCSGLTALSAIRKTVPVVKRVRKWGKDVTVMVVGLGGLGQWSLNLFKYCCDAEDVENMKVIGVDISKEKIDHALKSKLIDEGFQFKTTTPGPVSQEVDQFKAQFDGNKAHIVLDFVNSTETFKFSNSLLHRGGIHVMIGLHGGLGELKLPMAVLNLHTVTGSYTGSLSELSELIDLVSKHSISAPPMLEYKLEEATRALHDVDKGQVLGRIILKPSGLYL